MDGTIGDQTARPARPERAAGPALADALRAATHDLHREAERSGILGEILRGKVQRRGYALLLRNLHAVYETLECRLQADGDRSPVATLAVPAVYRAGALAADLHALCGADWPQALPLLPAAAEYRQTIAAAGPGGMAGHAYTRYLGDLNGGQVLCRLLAQRLDLGRGALAFYDFPALADVGAFRADYRAAFDGLPLTTAQRAEALAAAAAAFRHNIALSRAVQEAELS